MITLSVLEIHCTHGFCDEEKEEDEEELGILVVGWSSQGAVVRVKNIPWIVDLRL